MLDTTQVQGERRMAVDETVQKQILQFAQGATALQIAYFGVAKNLFDHLGEAKSAGELAEAAGVDAGYCARWCDAAYAFEFLDESGDRFSLTPLGRAFVRTEPGSLFPAAVGSVLGAHMTERAAFYSATGERPGEKVLAERETILPLFGPMLEQSFGPLFQSEILPKVPVFAELNKRGGTVVDLGCGNGWYVRRLVKTCANLRGIGLDGFEENIRSAADLAEGEGIGDRVDFRSGDINEFSVEEPVDLIGMNRALHHVWNEKENVFRILHDHLKPGGSAVIWEPAWVEERSDLRKPGWKKLAVQNLNEFVQGNHLLRPTEIEEAFRQVGMTAQTYLFAGGTEAVIVGTRPG